MRNYNFSKEKLIWFCMIISMKFCCNAHMLINKLVSTRDKRVFFFVIYTRHTKDVFIFLHKNKVYKNVKPIVVRLTFYYDFFFCYLFSCLLGRKILPSIVFLFEIRFKIFNWFLKNKGKHLTIYR